MDAPGATSPDESAIQSTPEPDIPTARTTSPTSTTRGVHDEHQQDNEHSSSGSDDEEEEQDAEGEDESDDEDEEPRLKYAYLTNHLGSLYRNGDATSSFLVAGDKMIVGTHNGNVHVLSLPALQSLRVYHAHTASVTSVSISPFPPPLPNFKQDTSSKQASEDYRPPSRSSTNTGSIRGLGKQANRPSVPPLPSNSIYIATSSIDGNVCVSSLVDPKDVLLRNFGRPIQSVALSPEYKNDRTFLSGGRAGELILTVGGRIGASSNSTTMGGAAATASGWLGSMGLTSNNGKDTIIHSGEGIISTIKWSLSGKYVVWVNEEGIKIMRSNLHLESSETEFAWKRISHIDRPTRPGWDEMASVWKARAEWIDQSALDSQDNLDPNKKASSEIQPTVSSEKVEKLVVGWGGTVWVIDVYPERASKTSKGEKLGSAEVVTILRTDCVVSGISLYTPRLLVILAYMETEDQTTSDGRGSGTRNRQRGLEPELRVIDIETKEEISADTLSISRFEGLQASDYHLSVLPPWKTPEGQVVQRGALGALGYGLLDATMYPARLFSSGASIRSNTSSGDKGSGRVPPSFISKLQSSEESLPKEIQDASGAPGAKIFIHSPYDCVVAVKRDLADRLAWLDSHGQYEEAWRLVDEHPEAAGSTPDLTEAVSDIAGRSQTSLGDFFADDRSSIATAGRTKVSTSEQEKARLGELWLNQLVSEEKWADAAIICGKVIRSAPRWEHWVWVFIKNDKHDDITSQIPVDLNPPLSSVIYETILTHYLSRDLCKFKELVETWPSDLFDATVITETIEGELKSHSVQAGSEDWRTLTDCLAKLLLIGGHYREALRCYIRLQDGDTAMSLVREHRLLDAVTDDIPAFIMIRVSKEQMESAPKEELEELTSEPTRLLVSEAYTGIVPPDTVVTQLIAANRYLFLYFYLRALWRGESLPQEASKPRRGRGAYARDAASKLAADEGKALIDNFADTAIEVFAEYDRPLLMDFLQTSITYTFEKAASICEEHRFTPELIFLLSKMGQTKRALNLILSDLKDVSQAISFAKSQEDPDLWEDLLDYSMDKPKFIHGLLVEAGTAIDPIKLVRRIPSGLEIEGLREGLTRLIREHDLQASISQGAARVMQSEVALGMDTLRRGQRRGIKFDVIVDEEGDRNKTPTAKTQAQAQAQISATPGPRKSITPTRPGRCGGCKAAFRTNEREILVGFACGHIFHLSHLHPDTSQQQSGTSTPDPSSDRTPRPMSPVEEPLSATASRTVGPKVTTARILRDKVGDGCRICALSRQIETIGVEGED
ncbi:hypothetical protein N7535_003728 [Penicillium sp. DV-2018c]|nr:hypothetical protein N7461_000571 [Penicillium sp. DV-2018c]KAJ5576802.1 hypothetical protein N7535_003728 [Penicillium sp. DV-2018c]